MKKISLCLFFFLSLSSIVLAQEFKQPSEGKSLVYFVCYSGTGSLTYFKYFDGDKYLGKINGVHYFTYECEAGEHIFWASSENRDFIKSDLKPNSTYLIEVRATMGGFKTALRLYQIDPTEERIMKKVNKLIAKRPEKGLYKRDEDMSFFIKNGLERYERIKEKVDVLNPDLTF